MKLKTYIRQYIKMAAQNIYLPAVYGLYSRKKRTGAPRLIILADAHHDLCPESMQLLAQKLRSISGQPDSPYALEEMYLDYGKASFFGTLRHMTRFMKLYAGARAVVISDNFLPVAGCRKKAGTKVLQLWHACGAMKRFGYDTTDDIPSYYRGNVFRNIDRVTVSSPECVTPFASAMRLPETAIWPAGVSRTDLYFDKKWVREARERFFDRMPEAKGKKIVVWAPTFRGSPGDPGCISLDMARLAGKLGPDYIVIEKLHPHMRRKAAAAGKMPANVMTDCPFSTQELFPVTDVLIADYSSLIYEYALFKKPLVLYVPDYDSYVDQRGFYMDYHEIPARQVRSEEELADAVKHAAFMEQENSRFLASWMSACDGKSTRRILKWLVGPGWADADRAKGTDENKAKGTDVNKAKGMPGNREGQGHETE